jgi:hypothetical protein
MDEGSQAQEEGFAWRAKQNRLYLPSATIFIRVVILILIHKRQFWIKIHFDESWQRM